MIEVHGLWERRGRKVASLLALILLLSGLALGQSGQDQSQIPDAPSASRPVQFPSETAPAPKNTDRNPSSSSDATSTSDDGTAALPPPSAGTAAPNGGGNGDTNSRADFVIPIHVSLVVVPVTVKDPNGRLVDGLLKKDFIVRENGVEQRVTLFTSDPFPLSAAVVIDANLSPNATKKINETLPALAGAFSEFDEVGVFTYGSSVERRLDFRSANEGFSKELRRIKPKGRTGATLVNAGPLAAGPTVNGRPLDPTESNTTVGQPPREFYVLNDAILAAATDLSRRDRKRRKVIFVISDGREQGSTASYDEVLKVLLSNEISVYAIGVDAAAIPGYDKVAEVRLPKMGYGNILPKYVSATGGEVFAEFTRGAIETAYARLTEQARNQYTLGYNASNVLASNYRDIEVLVRRPGLEVRSKAGYYPLPPRRE